jgi:DNA-binding transcriptional LysR family regulator
MSSLAEAGATPRVRFEAREYGTARALASAGLSAAIMPRAVAEEPGPPIRITRLDPEPRVIPCVAWSSRRRPNPALAAFIDFMRDFRPE